MEELQKNENRLFWGNLCYFIILTLFVILRIFSTLGWLNFAGDYTDALFTFFTQILILFAVPLFFYTVIYKQKPKQIFKAFGYKKISPKIALCSVGMGFVAFFIIIFVSTFFSIFIQMLGYEPYVVYGENTKTSFWTFLLSMLTVAVMPAMFEEFSHRGMLLFGFSKISSMKAVVLSGLLFGLMHLNINQFFYAFVVGMLLATVALIARSIWPSVIIHFINNGLNTYIDYASTNGLFGGNFSEIISLSNVNILLRFFIYIFIVCLVVYACIWLLIKMFTITKKEQFYKFTKEFAGIKDPNQMMDIDNVKELLTIYLSEGKSIDYDLKQLNDKKLIENTEKINESGVQTVDKQEQLVASQVPQVVMRKSVDDSNTLQEPKIDAKARKLTLTQLMETILPKSEYDKYKPTFKENFFLYCSIFLGSVITIMTFIWGLF